MDELEQFRDRLERSLLGVLERPRVSAMRGDYYKILGTIISPTFEDMDEGKRQEIVWERVLDTFDEDDQRRIEFLYTDAPSEVGPEAEPEPA